MAKPIPKETWLAVLKRAGGRCESCEEPHPLDLHHLTNRQKNGDPIFGHETPADLRALCRPCHHAEHLDPDGDFWEDIDELNWLLE